MSLVTIRCPHCGRELNVPQDAEKIVCMYCAKPIDAQELLNHRQPDIDVESLLAEIERTLPEEVFTTRLDADSFNATNYPATFEKYKDLFEPSLQSFLTAAQVDEDYAADRFAEILSQHFEKELAGKKRAELFGCRYTITALTVPAVLSLDRQASEKAVDSFLKKWKQNHPKDSLGKASYEKILSGFHHKLCYITTAVCSSLGAGDNCRELNEFRAFRDNWLADAPDGKAKILEYYLFAPMIVQAIDQSGQAQKEYRRIWDEHLVPCLREIRSGRQDDCARDYEKMVRSLEQKWLS